MKQKAQNAEGYQNIKYIISVHRLEIVGLNLSNAAANVSIIHLELLL
jgi:hypothetical protein